MVCAQRNQKVDALPPQRADKPLAQRIGLRTLWWCFENPEAKMAYEEVELRGENAVAVVQEKTVAMEGRAIGQWHLPPQSRAR